MFKIAFSTPADSGKSPISKQHRLMGAIAALVLISLLTSSGGSPIQHTISNCWEGFIWGIADPVIDLNRLAGIIAIGLLSARFIRGAWIGLSFVLAAFCGQVIHLCQLNFPGAEIAMPTASAAIAICTMVFGVILFLPTQIGWLACTILSVIAGLFHGYANSQAIMGAEMLTVAAYLIGVILTQTAIVLSAREIGTIIKNQASNQVLTKTIHWIGLTFCAIGIVFLANAVI
ncbi:HupE/UreJ family protein [Anabaena sphaerica FACHB-251]|uniref:HupE/UreJ family protein n=1 Tax=Anabaena sphaerica FACHB-251 TaxID=2692883 RepID=A0A927A0L7_9NOST|nr:HupE/UreJ family protein [Anabaena sphaerica]MBD2293603.1 HupE/UreJ family protein [Anabaena sphaerica FACHB-251]